MSRSLRLLLLIALGVSAPLFAQDPFYAGMSIDTSWDRKTENAGFYVNISANQSTTSPLTLTGTLPPGASQLFPGTGFVCDPPSNGTYTCHLGSMQAGAFYQVAFFVTSAPNAPTTVYTTTAQINVNGITNNATASVTAYGRIDLASAITGPPTIVAGSTGTYDVTVRNNSSNTALAGWKIYSDTVGTPSPGAVFTGIAADPDLNCSVQYPTSYVVCIGGDLAPGASKTVHLTVKAASNLEAPVKVGAYADASDTESPEKDTSNNGASATSGIAWSSDLAITGSAPSSASNGGDVPVNWTISNAGASDASSVVFDTTLPATATFLSLQQTAFTCSTPSAGATGAIHCTAPSLGAAKQSTITVTMRPTAAGTITSSATVSNSRTDPAPANNSASVSTTITESTSAHADVSITATASAPRVRTNGAFDITLNVANAGPDTASSIVVTEALANGFTATSVPSACSGTTLITCSIPTLAAGGSTSLELQIRAAGSAGSYMSTATISTPNDTTNNNNSAAVATTVVPSVNLFMAASVNPKFAFPGSNVVWTFKAYASGYTTELITLTDVLPSGMTVVNMPPNCSGTTTITCSMQLTYDINITLALPSTPGTYANSATLTSIADNDPSDNSASASVVARTGTDVVLTGSLYANPQGGELMAVNFDITNEGPATVDPLTIAVTFPEGSEILTDSYGCSTSGVVFTCTSAAFGPGPMHLGVGALAPLVPGTYIVTARITAPGDINPANDVVSIPVTVGTPPASDLEVSSIAPFSVGVGDTFQITAVVKVKGPGRPHQAVLTDTIPAGTTLVDAYGPCQTQGEDVICSFGSFTNGGSYEQQVTLTLRAPLTPGPITNRMAVTSFKDPVPANDSATQVVQVTAAPLPNVRVFMEQSTLTASTGGRFVFAAYFENTGDTTIASSDMQITLPAGSVVNSVSPASACSSSGPTISCHSAFAPLQRLNVAVEATAPSTAGSYSVTAKAITPDSDPRDDQVTRTLDVSAPSYTTDLAVHINGPHAANRGDDLTYVITLANSGGDANNLTLTDVLPSALRFRSLTIAGTPINCQTPAAGNSGDIRCVAAMYGQTQSTMTIVARVSDEAPPSFTHAVHVTNGITDPDYRNNDDSIETLISTAPDLAASIEPVASVMAGSAVTLQTALTNSGNASAAAITVTYTIDHGMVASASGAPCVANGNGVTCSIASLAAAASTPISIVVNLAPVAGQTKVSMTATTSGDINATNDSATATVLTFAPRRRPGR